MCSSFFLMFLMDSFLNYPVEEFILKKQLFIKYTNSHFKSVSMSCIIVSISEIMRPRKFFNSSLFQSTQLWEIPSAVLSFVKKVSVQGHLKGSVWDSVSVECHQCLIQELGHEPLPAEP